MTVQQMCREYRGLHLKEAHYVDKPEGVSRFQRAGIANMDKGKLVAALLLISEGYDGIKVLNSVVSLTDQ